jgi:hypothetical protein
MTGVYLSDIFDLNKKPSFFARAGSDEGFELIR